MNITVQITGDQALINTLKKLDSSISDFSNVFNDLGKDLTTYFRDTAFDSKGGIFGTPWARLAPSTVAYKLKHFKFYASVPLMATGTMRRSFTAKADSKTLTIGNSSPYFIYHQSNKPRKRIPRRQMIGVNNDVINLMKKVITDDIHHKIRAA